MMQLRQSAVRNVTCGENVVIYEPANLYDCTLGDNVFVGPFVEIQGNTQIGADSKIQSHTFICEYVTLGARCFIGHGVMFANTVCDGAVIGAGSVVTKSITEKGVYAGNPAKLLRRL
ncbi:MAG: N-acetyltransferase [Citrobacter freundii]|nr:N-acetyltransferase [Citrobacter freundii]